MQLINCIYKYNLFQANCSIIQITEKTKAVALSLLYNKVAFSPLAEKSVYS